jgi:N-acetylglucosaminyldiphosphoundecaprenol N-acetyl-beta-D-mannosaminyltransferase
MREILGVRISGKSYSDTSRKIIAWAEQSESKAVFFANVHMLMEAYDHPSLRSQLNQADIINPDGVPLVWALRLFGDHEAKRVYGPDATLEVLAAAEAANIPVGFFGAEPETLSILLDRVSKSFPSLNIVFHHSPPFRPITPSEDGELVTAMQLSGLKILFVGLGCPKQERWIMDHRGRLNAVMLAVGAAFDFLANTKPQAPRWIMRSGLEWLFRLLSEPRRLAGRYIRNNPRFVALIFLQWVKTGKNLQNN